jgi:hypothetical protein
MAVLSESLGHLFEVGFNIGMLATVEHRKLSNRFGDTYRQDLEKLCPPKLLKRLLDSDRIVSALDRQNLDDWIHFVLLKGYLSGLTFLAEYLDALPAKDKDVEIRYFQCSFVDRNSLGTVPRDFSEEVKAWAAQFGLSEIDLRYAKKGEFLKADSLLLLVGRKSARILAVDLSLFGTRDMESVSDLRSVEVIRRMIERERDYLRSRSVFSNLRIDGTAQDFSFGEDLARFFKAFKREDKEACKLIQAASYAESFHRFLIEQKLLDPNLTVRFGVVGYSDRGLCAMSLGTEDADLLQLAARIYKEDHKDKDKEILQARYEVFEQIRRAAAHSFIDGRQFIKALLSPPSESHGPLVHREQLMGHISPVDGIGSELGLLHNLSAETNLRDAHATLVSQQLTSDVSYVFLTGNPGIGKTTALVKFLKDHAQEGFLFLYASPRKKVNRDIIEKFTEGDKLSDDRILTLHTDSEVIASNYGRPTVRFRSNTEDGDFKVGGVDFMDDSTAAHRRPQRSGSLKRTKEDLISESSRRTSGVMKSLSEALYSVLSGKRSNCVVATVSIQSLKMIGQEGDTLKHLDGVFRDCINDRDGQVIPSKMRELSSRIRHIFVMVDEITGDDAGAQFLNGIHKLLKRFELFGSEQGFNTKVIVADASIVDPKVIEQHLEDAGVEPNKIFFRQAPDQAPALEVQSFRFRREKAAVINTNSYPARNLNVAYKVFVHSVPQRAENDPKPEDRLTNWMQASIGQDILEILKRPDSGQIVVYIQNKVRLGELISQIKQVLGDFERYRDYLEIHSDTPDWEAEKIQTHRDGARVIFMTASASRGLSFPKTKHILVDVPRFEIEKNLMEIIQVIYRGRGQYWEDGTEHTLDGNDKELVFYVGDRVVYNAGDGEISYQESALALLNLLLVLKTSIMTRICGAGQIGKQRFAMIPIGGKSVSAAGENFSSKMTALVKGLRKEYTRHKDHKVLAETYKALQDLLHRGDYAIPSDSNGGMTYLALREWYGERVRPQVDTNLAKLLSLKPLQNAHVSGGLLIVPLRQLCENYSVQSSALVKHKDGQLLEWLNEIAEDKSHPDSLRTNAREAVDLLTMLTERPETSQSLQQMSDRNDRYYAFPLVAIIAGDCFKEYFRTEEEPEEHYFKDILAEYVRAVYPTDGVLPIGYDYEAFPFIIFRSFNLTDVRKKIFSDQYLVTSRELSILNLVLMRSS